MEDSKPWYKSMTIVSLIGATLGVFIPRYAPLIPQTAGDIFTIINLISAAWGRVRAAQKIDVGSK
jgi:hypothetical protein